MFDGVAKWTRWLEWKSQPKLTILWSLSIYKRIIVFDLYQALLKLFAINPWNFTNMRFEAMPSLVQWQKEKKMPIWKQWV